MDFKSLYNLLNYLNVFNCDLAELLYKVTKHTKQTESQPDSLTYTSIVKKRREERKKKHSSSLLASDVTPPLYSPSLSIYEASWWVMKRKGQGECVFIRSKPIGQISTFHATTLWLQLVPFWLKQYIHLGHSYIISPILHLIGNVTQTAGRYYGIDLLQGLIHSPRYDINGV